jgi:dissimilatory sulfite reductase (desulfoviridin) alpha/beta subunit
MTDSSGQECMTIRNYLRSKAANNCMDAKIQTAISIRQLKPYLEAKIPPIKLKISYGDCVEIAFQ